MLEKLVISGIPTVKDLSLLPGVIKKFEDLGLVSLAIKFEGAGEIDWLNLSELKVLQSLDLAGCPISEIPSNFPPFHGLKTLNLSNTRISNIQFFRSFPNLEFLDISGTPLIDLSPLAQCKNLSQLEMSGVSPDKLPNPWISSLKKITLSPDKLSPEVTNLFKGLSPLTMFREPGNPEFKASATFWNAIESRMPNR
jgi:Leucine-rich repeat (LRR) protein